ncbi:MAG TPA: AAA family ATPase, partial [Gaiellaceae bacterium]
MERKLATVLFVDLVDSTGLVADADPEVVRRRVSRFFDQVSRCIVTHGGTVEKFAGDAVMAAFGVPLAHEDDAERAVRAGLATLDRVKDLGLQARIGIESGEVVADDGESTFATGEAVNLASRLQAYAGPNEILVGPGAASLVRGRVELEPIGELDLRGWRDPIAAHRVVCAVELSAPLRNLAAPLVGRESELELLENTYERAVRDRRAALFTIYGDPGVGKSRLAREFVAGLEGATVLIGRCLPYGEGVTYWPLAEMVKASSGITDDDPLDEAQRKLREYCEDEAVADLLGLAVGVLEAVEGERAQQEIAWAARAWAEQLAEAQPLVLVFEDVHWGEEPLLELL